MNPEVVGVSVSKLSSCFKFKGNLLPREDFPPLTNTVSVIKRRAITFWNERWTPTVGQRSPGNKADSTSLSGFLSQFPLTQSSGLGAEALLELDPQKQPREPGSLDDLKGQELPLSL